MISLKGTYMLIFLINNKVVQILNSGLCLSNQTILLIRPSFFLSKHLIADAYKTNLWLYITVACICM